MPGDVRELIGRIKEGDEDSFAELCSDYSKLLDSSSAFYASRGAEYGALADDFRQEASMALYRAAMSYDLEQSAVTFGLYAKTCIRNALISQLRKYGARARGVAKESAISEDNAEQTVITEEMRRMYMRRIDGILSDFEAKVLMMTIEGQRPRQIAKSMHTDAKAVSNALFRARTKLRDNTGDR
jgi:RNA polymerase sporulation-specific sigma factor